MKTTADRLVDDYLKRLSHELRDLPRTRRRELVDDIASHIDEARGGMEAENEVEIRNLLERLGDPAEIAAEERTRHGVGERRAGWREILTLIGLLVGGFVFVIGWFVALVLLWVSDACDHAGETRRDAGGAWRPSARGVLGARHRLQRDVCQSGRPGHGSRSRNGVHRRTLSRRTDLRYHALRDLRRRAVLHDCVPRPPDEATGSCRLRAEPEVRVGRFALPVEVDQAPRVLAPSGR